MSGETVLYILLVALIVDALIISAIGMPHSLAILTITIGVLLFIGPENKTNMCKVDITKEHISVKGDKCNYTFKLPKP